MNAEQRALILILRNQVRIADMLAKIGWQPALNLQRHANEIALDVQQATEAIGRESPSAGGSPK